MESLDKTLWSDAIDEIIAGDQAVVLAYPTPLGGVVLTPVTNFATRDRAGGVVTVNSSIGAWRKLDRIRRAPRVALAFHTRNHSRTDRPEYVLLQGAASLSAPIADFPASIGARWEQFDGPRADGLWKPWMRVYYTRVAIDVAVERVVSWDDLGCRGLPTVTGPPLPADGPAPQRPPARGTASRVDHRRAAGRLSALPDVLTGWLDADGRPFVVPASIGSCDETGFGLDVDAIRLPTGGRRAGLTGHSFTRFVTGQHQRLHTGWLDVDARGRAHYAPHTARGHRLPPSSTIYRLAVGGMTRVQLRGARRSGLLDALGE